MGLISSQSVIGILLVYIMCNSNVCHSEDDSAIWQNPPPINNQAVYAPSSVSDGGMSSAFEPNSRLGSLPI